VALPGLQRVRLRHWLRANCVGNNSFVTTGLALIVPVEVVCPVFVFSGKLPLFTVGLGDEVGAGFCGLTTFAVAVLPAAVFGPDG